MGKILARFPSGHDGMVDVDARLRETLGDRGKIKRRDVAVGDDEHTLL